MMHVFGNQVIGEFLDAAKEETIKAMNLEIDRLKAEQTALDTAGSALASLKVRTHGCDCSLLGGASGK